MGRNRAHRKPAGLDRRLFEYFGRCISPASRRRGVKLESADSKCGLGSLTAPHTPSCPAAAAQIGVLEVGLDDFDAGLDAGVVVGDDAWQAGRSSETRARSGNLRSGFPKSCPRAR